ncbi:EAL domain-containing protein [Dechloromonas sp. XY25]|uniref:EAL domain-containing protein n=1 Tax=Dechloromonas hankyongensis TaxID=2908002 RepID=A0ABS9JY93_9RHOO|nr:bifunctional diguanylate cyclase/phosphodiesterase [Dechloromonas hankyongensis]MCG2575856.1 EAL domain-containing protein [Dechloromonas hankyongensis]
MTSVSDEMNWFRKIFESSPDPALMIEANCFVDCNGAAVETLGYPSREVLLNLHPSALSPPDQPDGQDSFAKAEHILTLVQERGFHCFEWLHRRADGSDFLAEVTLSCVNFQGRTVILCVWSDLSTRRYKERRLHELLQEQRLIFDHARVGILMLCNRRILKCNQHIADMFGYASPDELEGQTTENFYGSQAHFADVGREAYAQLASKGFTSFETEMFRRDGSRIWVIQSGCPLNPGAVLDAPSIWVYTDITQRKLAGVELERSEEKFAKAFDSCPLAASISAADDGRFLEINASYERNFGWSRDDLIGKTSLEVGFWPTRQAREAWLAAISRRGRLTEYETTWLHKAGSQHHVILSSETIDLNGQRCILTYVTDISGRRLAEADLRIAAAAFESQEGMVITDARGVILRVNKAFTDTTGYSAEEVLGQTPRILRSGRHDDEFYRQMWATVIATGTWQGEVWDRRKSGEIYPKWLTITAVKDEAGNVSHYIGTHIDITERKRSEERIKTLAFYDQLTGLPNRTLLVDRLRQAQLAGVRSGDHGALLFIDLDNFKTLNDTYGHDRGDRLLRQVASRLTQVVRLEDTVARIGGDEFVVVLSTLGEQQEHAASIAEMIADKILAILYTPYLLSDTVHRSSASIGVTLFQGERLGVDELMKQADLAMYKSKESGRNLVRFFDPTLESAVRVRAELEGDLRAAIEHGQLQLYYQPQVAVHGCLTGAEALVRWNHPLRGVVSPADFIPLAEETGLIVQLGQFVLETACRQLAAWAGQPDFADLSIAVNVSARQLRQDDFVHQVQAALTRSGANPVRLKLELTESVLVDNVQEIIEKMLALREIGIGFALDDFGTGYSSLSYLKRLPLDQLKIDQTFVRDVLEDPSDATIARTIVALARALDLGVIAEGVETAAQLDFLREAGCYAYQGYFFSRPLPVVDFEAYVHRRTQRAVCPTA